MIAIILSLIVGALILIGLPITIVYCIDKFVLQPRRMQKKVKELEERIKKLEEERGD